MDDDIDAKDVVEQQQLQGDADSRMFYKTVGEFVEDFVCQIYRRNVGEAGRSELRWSAHWRESPEAQARFDAMWRAWERARTDAAGGMSVWFRDHGDYHMSVLMSPNGPFAFSKETSTVNDPLPSDHRDW